MVGDWNQSCYSSQCMLNVFLDTSWRSGGYISRYSRVIMDNVDCSGSEERLGDCDFAIISNYRTSYSGVGVTCQPSEHNVLS